MREPRYPSLYQINTRVCLQELGRELGRPATLADIPDASLDRLVALGFDWVWLLGVWQTGPAGRQVALSHPDWQREYRAVLGDYRDEDVSGSPFAIQSYTVDTSLGGEDALQRLRLRLHQRGIRLLLDFVPNHTAPDHRWTKEHPEFYVQGTPADLAREPHNYLRVETCRGPLVLAHGRDPYFPGWPDTLQLNYFHPRLREAVITALANVAAHCDGVRCDMAMLLLPDVFARTWGDRARPADGAAAVTAPFWPEATSRVRQELPAFRFMAEVYWDLEWTLQQQGFDYTYDKRYYDRIHAREAESLRGHLLADAEFQRKSVRFLENHGEPRAASAFPPKVYGAAAVLTYSVPGMRFFHEGQLEGRHVRVPIHLRRRPDESADPVIRDFYERLLAVLKRPELRDGRWQLLDCRPAWEENRSWERYIASSWQGTEGQLLVVVVNYGPEPGQCYVKLPFPELKHRKVCLRDLMSADEYQRVGNELVSRGLYLDMPDWSYHVFEVRVH